MVVGFTLMKLDGNPYYSPQFNRGGNAAQFSAQILAITADGEIDIDVEHKNADDTSWSLLVSFATASVVSLITADSGGIKEQLRFKYTVDGTHEYDAVHLQMLAPTWRPY